MLYVNIFAVIFATELANNYAWIVTRLFKQ